MSRTTEHSDVNLFNLNVTESRTKLFTFQADKLYSFYNYVLIVKVYVYFILKGTVHIN